MSYRDYREPLDLQEIADPALRKNVFRAMSTDLLGMIKQGGVTDRAGSMARMMEMAYKAGLQAASTHEVSRPAKAKPRAMTEMDLPPLPRRQLETVRLYLFGSRGPGGRDSKPDAIHLALVMSPKFPGFPSSMTHDKWSIPGLGANVDFSNKSVLPWIKAGLYEATEPDENDWRYARMTEWGYEFLVTGSTSPEGSRRAGASTTFKEYNSLVRGRDLEGEAQHIIGLIRKPERPQGYMR